MNALILVAGIVGLVIAGYGLIALSSDAWRRRQYLDIPFCAFAFSAQVEECQQREPQASQFPTRTHLPSAVPSSLGRPGVHNSTPSFSWEVSVYFRAPGRRVTLVMREASPSM